MYELIWINSLHATQHMKWTEMWMLSISLHHCMWIIWVAEVTYGPVGTLLLIKYVISILQCQVRDLDVSKLCKRKTCNCDLLYIMIFRTESESCFMGQ